MAITQSTQAGTVKSIVDVQGVDGIRYKQINLKILPDTGTTKLAFDNPGGFYQLTAGATAGRTETFYMKATGAGTLPAVGDVINCVLG